MQLPARLLIAARLEHDLFAIHDRLLDLVFALGDGAELALLAVDHQLGRVATAHVVDEARELAADRHAQKLVVFGHVEIDRWLAGIGRRRDPEVRDHRRRRRKSRSDSSRHAIGTPAAGRPRMTVWTQGSWPAKRSRWAAATNSATSASSGIRRGHNLSQASAAHAKPTLRANPGVTRPGAAIGVASVASIASFRLGFLHAPRIH